MNSIISVADPAFVLVGVDGSPTSDAALDWACDEAVRRGLDLHVLHALDLAGVIAVSLIAAGSTEGDEILASAEERAGARTPGVVVTTAVSLLDAQEALVRESATAALLVVGARGAGGLIATVLGSVSSHVATRAQCPVLVVPGQSHRVHDNGVPHVVVGFDDSPQADVALSVAAHEAMLLDAELRVVMAWTLETVDGMVVTTPGSPQWLVLEERQTTVMDAAVRHLHAAAPELAALVIRTQIVHGHPVEVLLEQSRDAQVLVVGSRGRGGLRSLFVGSVSGAVLDRAHRPVVVTSLHARTLDLVGTASAAEPRARYGQPAS